MKNSVPLTLVRLRGIRAVPLPEQMSLTSTVPAAVPSLFHSSSPLVPSLAMKNSVPSTSVRLCGSRTGGARTDVLHQHRARGGAVALPQLVAVGAVASRKNSVPPTSVRYRGYEP